MKPTVILSIYGSIKKRLNQPVKPFSLEQCGYPINNAINYTCRNTVHNHRTGKLTGIIRIYIKSEVLYNEIK